MTLSESREGDELIIERLSGPLPFRHRMAELGLLTGKTIRVVRYAPFKDPLEFTLHAGRLALRIHEADQVHVHLIRRATESGQS
ncbi:MAG: hypothetical protein A2293_06165 [Elusimicrobia bacterium RIFOXYB2_FULL_49_7]|nr:MAG: hypothetical protein A2293_06165 [Elusimicrobia bacterium RIFOXYB2_FULL_49_7]